MAREIEQTDQVIRALDSLRVDLGISKAEVARPRIISAARRRACRATGSMRCSMSPSWFRLRPPR